MRDVKVEDKFFLTPPDFERQSVESFAVGESPRQAQVKVCCAYLIFTLLR